MDYSHRLAISYYKTIAVLDEQHKIYLVQHQETQKIFIKKILDVYNVQVYQYLQQNCFAGIPRIIDFYEEHNQLTVIEEYISGDSLQEKMEAPDFSVASITHYISELCIILGKLHSANPPIVHRDIKPSNIIITYDNHVVLLDFNAAKYYTESHSADTVLLGTHGYAAPEQYGFGSSSPLTDIYSLGILLKELSSALPDVPKQFAKIISKCTEINPSDRFKTVEELNKAVVHSIASPNVPNSKSFHLQSYIPPGFRTLTPWKMLISSIIYLLIFWLCLSLEVKNTFGIALWIERIFCLFMMLSVVFGTFNYLNFQALLPICKHRIRIIRYIGIILLDLLLVITLFIVMVLIEVLFFL